MSIFSGIKSLLGFGPDTTDPADTTLYADTTEAGSQTAPPPAQEIPAEPAVAAVEFSQARAQAIFEHVVEIFNQALPDFLSRTADPEAQRKYLYESLDAGLKEYLASLAEAARAFSEAQWLQRQNQLSAELESVRHRAEEVEKRSKEIKQSQLSADRQKRALTERVHDLESQLARLEAEREQFELENRSLLNRLKVAGVQGEEAERSLAEMETLRARVRELQLNPDAEVLRQKEALEARVAEMEAGHDAMKEQVRLATEMLDDMRRRHKEAETLAEERAGQLQAQAALIADCEKALLQVEELETTIKTRDQRISQLEKTVSANLQAQARREKELQDQIAALRPPTVVPEMTVNFGPTEETAPKITEDDLTAMEETFENGDWFTKTPPAETPSMRPPEDDANFGYQAPAKRKSHTANSAQLSLFE